MLLPSFRLPSLAIALLPLLVAAAAAAEGFASRVVEPRLVAQARSYDGRVEATEQSVVAAQTAGRVIDLRVDVGQRVRRGELLLRIDAREAGESVAAARAALANARATLARTRDLQRQGFVSQAAVDKAQADADVAQASSAAAAATQSHATITAPIDGVVATRHVERGEMAVPGRPLVTLFDPRGLRVSVAVPQYRLDEVRGARRAIIEFPESGRRIDAAQFTVLPVADRDTHATTVRVALPAGIAAAIPGAAARVHFVTGEVRRLSVPAAAIQRRGEVASVYVRAADGSLALRQLRLGETLADGEVDVLAGLVAGETIALDPVAAAMALKAAPRPAPRP